MFYPLFVRATPSALPKGVNVVQFVMGGKDLNNRVQSGPIGKHSFSFCW